MVTATSEAIDRALRAGAEAVERVEHPACSTLVAMRAALGELVEYLGEVAGAVTGEDDLHAELDALARELSR